MDFLEDQSPSGFLIEGNPQAPSAQGQISKNKKEQDVNYTTGKSSEELTQEDIYKEVAGQEVTPSYTFDSETAASDFFERFEDQDSREDAVQKQINVQSAIIKMGEFSATDKAMAADPRVGATLWEIEHKAGKARNILLDKAEEFEDGWGGKVLELIDQVAYDTITDMMDIPDLLSGEGSEVSELSDMYEVALRTLSEEEFDLFLSERLDEITNGAWSGTEPRWRVMRELQALEAAGSVLWDEEMGVLYGIASALDLATVGLTAAPAALKTASTIGRAGRSVIGRLRSTAGSAVATEAAQGTALVVRKGLDGEVLTDPLLRKPPSFTLREDIIDADFVDDIIPSATRTVAVPATPPVSSSRVLNTFNNNIFVRRFLSQESRFGFGTFDLDKAAGDWAAEHAVRLTDGSGSQLLDFNVVDEGLQNAKVTFTFGKEGGQAFNTFESAQEFAKRQASATVIDVDTGRVVTASDPRINNYAVQIEARPQLKQAIDATNLNEVASRTVIGRIFGRASTGSSSFFSNLADRGVSGSLGFMHDNKGAIKAINALKKPDRQVVDEILTTLRDTPTRGNPRQWLSTAEFSDAYRQKTGRMPSRDVMKAYETVIQASDFNWWVKASERLHVLAENQAQVVRVKDSDILAFPTEHKPTDIPSKWVWDAGEGIRRKASSLDPNTPLMKLGQKTKDGSSYVANYSKATRIPTLQDAFPYNAGGPRSNPNIRWFVGNSKTSWATLIGTRSEKEAAKTVEQFNNIAKEVSIRVGPDNDVSKLTRSQKRELDDVVRANNEWNPNLENIDDYFKFTNTRGVTPYEAVNYRGSGERLVDVIQVHDKSLVDLSLDSYISYHRHDDALLEFGGVKTANPDPLLAVQTQFNQMVTRGAHTQYRMNHPTAWVKAVNKALKQKQISVGDLGKGSPMSDELKVANWKIEGRSQAAIKLRQEQSVIARRLNMFEGSTSDVLSSSREAVSRKTARWAEVAYDWNPKLDKMARAIFETNYSNAALGAGFWQKMASPDQVLLQSMHILPMTAISPKNAARAGTIALAVRQAARTGDASLWNKVFKNIVSATGISEANARALLDHMQASGRGYMRGAIAEDPAAGMTNTVLGKVKDIASAPYYAGENFSATTSRVTAFLDTLDEFPTISTDSREFWNLVDKRDRALSMGLMSSQRSTAQSESLSRVITQWTSYPLTNLEHIFVGGIGLTKKERGRLALYTTLGWGLAGLGASKTAAYFQENFGFFGEVIAHGADVALENSVGIRVGQRVGINPIEVWERAIGTFSDPAEHIPAWTITENSVLNTYYLLANVLSGRTSLLAHDAERLARVFKVVDGPIMAWSMATEEVRRSANGNEIQGPFTPTQVVFQALGVTPVQATELQNKSSLIFNAKDRKSRAIKVAMPYARDAIQAAEDGNYALAEQKLLDMDAIVNAYGLSDTYLAEARNDIIQQLGYDRVSWVGLELLKLGYEKEALRFNNTMEN